MDDLFSLRDNGLFLRREALQSGYDDAVLQRGLRDGVLTRVRHGAYFPSTRWGGLDELQRHVVLAQAVAASHNSRVVFSHQTAAAIQGIDMWRPDLSRVHVTRLGPGVSGRHEAGIIYHAGSLSSADWVEYDGLPVTVPPRAAMEAAAASDIEAGLVVLDAALRIGVPFSDLARMFDDFRYVRGHNRLQLTIRLARPGTGSAGESRSRYFFWRHRIPMPILQYEVRDARGNLLGIVDFYWPEYGVIGEFDGRVKYDSLLRPGESPADAVVREKWREDRIRAETGCLFFRWGHNDLREGTTAATTAKRLRETLERGRRLMDGKPPHTT